MMNTKFYHIAVIEDNPFYRMLFCEKLRMILEYHQVYTIKFFQFETPAAFLASNKQDYSIIFLDYFFDNHLNASEMIHHIREKCHTARIYLLSEVLNHPVSDIPPIKGIDGYMPKDEATIGKCSVILMEHMHHA